MEQKYQKNQAIGTGFDSVRRCRAGLAVIADLIRNRPFNSCLWRRAVSLCALFLLTGAVVLLISSCETEYIPDTTENGHTTLIAKEGNFNLDLRFAGFGEGDMTPDPRSMEASKIDMKPETDIIRVDDDLYIYATLSVDPVDQAPPVRTRLFNTDARIRIIVYDSTATDTFTKKLETLYRDSMGTLVREDLVGYKINLDAGDYKFIAYSYNTTTPPPTWADTLTNIDSSNDLIWGMSPTVSIVQNATAPIPVPISMFHKMSQVKLVAKTGPSGPNITAFSGVSMPGYAVNMATFSGTISKTSDTPVPLTFNFPTVGSDSITSDTRTVYTAGNIPTIITIGTLTVDGRPSLTNVPATFAKSLQSGYSYTMRMQIGDSPALTDDEPPKGFVPYIGAFWKHDQVGERLIRMPRILNDSADGVWTAHVIEGKSWILLDTLASPDGGVWTSSPNALGNTGVESYTLSPPDASTFVSGFLRADTATGYRPGDEYIYFRIGLVGTVPEDSVRYGTVLLTYGHNNYRHRIWIRQGEAADYVMRNEDALTGGTRSLTVEFSPYNLTTKDLPEYTGTPTSFKVDPRGGEPVEYPTQAGAFWYWAVDNTNATDYLRIAFHPAMPPDYSAWSPGWLNESINTGYDTWEEVTQSVFNSETCPPGYRRPRDGAIDQAVPSPAINDSEIRQSLWLNPPTGTNDNTDNSVWGYYADGYFDRLNLQPPPTSGPGGAIPIGTDLVELVAVRPSTKDVGYMGRLVYNPNNFASLFFPAAGQRSSNGTNFGGLGSPGHGGFYWTATVNALSLHSVWGLDFFSGVYDSPDEFEMATSFTLGEAMSIRCVKSDEPDFLISRESWLEDPATPENYNTPANKVKGVGKPGSPRAGLINEYYDTNIYGREGAVDGNTSGPVIDYLVEEDRIYIKNITPGSTNFEWVRDDTMPNYTPLSFPGAGTALSFNPTAGDGIEIGGTSGNGNGYYSIKYNNPNNGPVVHTVQVTNVRDGLDTAHPLLIENRADLMAIDDDFTANMLHYEIAWDIDISDAPWDPLSSLGSGPQGFQGTFYGNFYAIDGMTITQDEADNTGFFSFYTCGLFALLDGGRIQALGVTNVDINYEDFGMQEFAGAGAIVGANNFNSFAGQILDCYSSGTIIVSGAIHELAGIGGIIGSTYASFGNMLVSRCYSSADVSADGASGGIVGNLNSAELSQCFTTGDISDITPVPVDERAYTGGVVGAVGGISIITACYSTGTVHGYTAVGGILGEVEQGNDDRPDGTVILTNCFSTADISGFNEVGGIVGRITQGSEVSHCVALNRSILIASNSANDIVVGNDMGGTVLNNHAYENISGFIGDWDFTTATTFSSYIPGLTWNIANWRMKTSTENSTYGTNANLPILNNVTIGPQNPILVP